MGGKDLSGENCPFNKEKKYEKKKKSWNLSTQLHPVLKEKGE